MTGRGELMSRMQTHIGLRDYLRHSKIEDPDIEALYLTDIIER
jgi:hypothetical protein